MDIFPQVGVVIEHIPIPELHLLLGITNRLYKECVSELPAAEQWSKQFNLVRERYHSKTFEGNECKKLLDNVPVLETICSEENANSRVWKIVRAFKSFQCVVHSCFGNTLRASYEEDLARFTTDFMATGIPVSSKAHILMDHVRDFCASHNCGLGQFSEQASEGIHREFIRFWERHLVKDSAATCYGPNLLQTVLEYTAEHIG